MIATTTDARAEIQQLEAEYTDALTFAAKARIEADNAQAKFQRIADRLSIAKEQAAKQR